MAENDETSDKNLSTSENTKTCQQIESQNMPESQIIHRYNREEMLKIRENALSRTRPKEFSKEFDNEDGFFSPDKWLQHKWQCEGVENRGGKQRGGKASSNVSGTNAALPAAGIGTAKLLGAIFEASSNNQNGLDQQMILSPQRRGFSSGCRASSPSRNNDKDEEKTSKSRWRQGHLSSNGMDFKPAFQKSALEANNNGRTSSSRSTSNNVTSNITVGGNGSFSTMLGGSSTAAKQQNWDKDKNRRSIGGGERSRYSTHTGESEQMPEWMNDGPTSHLDIIELKGFDDDNSAGGANNANNSANEKNQKRRRSSKGKETSSAAWVIGTQSKTSNKDGSGGGGGSDEKMKGGGRNVTSSSSTRQKRHSSGDIGGNKNNHSHSNSRPTSRNTPSCASRKNSAYSPANPAKFIQASDLESYILMEHQNKLNKEKGTDGKFDLFSTLGIEPPKQQKMTNQEEKAVKKLPNTDAEFAEFIFGVPANQIGGNQKISGAKQEPTSSRLSRFFANNATDENGKQQLNKNSQKSIKEDKLLTKSQFDISALQQALYQQGFGGGRQSSSPLNNILTGPSPHLRPASTELSQQQQQRFSSPSGIVFRGQQQSPATLNNLMRIGVMSSHNKFLPGMAFGPGPNISPEREALFQQMQAANLPMPTGGLHSQQHHFSPSPVQQFQQQQQFMMNQFRKPQRTSPPTMQQMPPHALLPPGVGVVHHPPSLPRPSSVEHQFLNSSSPMMFRQQSPQMGMPPFGPNFNNGFAHFPMHIQHLLLDTARRMQPNPNIEPGQEHVRAAFYELVNQKEPKLRHYMMQQWQNNPNLNQFGLPFGHGGGGGSFPPMGNPSPFHPSSQMFGPPPPFHPHNQQGIGMHHGGGGGQFGFPPPPGGGPVPVPTIPPHVPQQFGGGPPPPPYFHPSNQFAANMNPLPPQQFSQLPPNAVNHHQKQPPQPNNPTNLLNSTFFMPTSVMRQMSKMPGGSGGGSNNGGGGDSFVDLGPNSANNNSSIFLQKLLGGGETATNLVKSGGRAILGRDPDEDGGGLPSSNVPRISGCLKLEDIEQRELAALQQQQPQSSSTSSSSRNPPTISSSNDNANAPITADPPTAAKQQNTANAANFL